VTFACVKDAMAVGNVGAVMAVVVDGVVIVVHLVEALVRDPCSSDTGPRATASGGTLASVLEIFDNFTFADFRQASQPYALSPVPNPRPASSARTSPSTWAGLVQRLTGLVTLPVLGMQTTSLISSTDTPIVQRTWGLLASTPQAYGPNFSFAGFSRARSFLHGIMLHYALVLAGAVLATPLRLLARRFVYQPGEGPPEEAFSAEEIEVHGVASPDLDASNALSGRLAFCRFYYRGSMYYRESCFFLLFFFFFLPFMTLPLYILYPSLPRSSIFFSLGFYTPASLDLISLPP
jgi:hypothetical protein